MPFLSSLKRALTFNFLLVASVPVLVFGLVNIDFVSDQQLKGVQKRTDKQALSVAGEVESFLFEVSSDLMHVKETIASGQILRQQSVNNFLNNVVRNSRFFESIYLVNEDFLIQNLGVLPRMLAHSEDYENLDFSGHVLFQDFDKTREQVWSNTFVSVVTGEPTVTLAMPMPQGALLGNIRLSSLTNLLQRYSTYSDITVAILDQRGTLVAHNVPEVTTQRLNYGNSPTIIEALEGEAFTTHNYNNGTSQSLESAVRLGEPQWVAWVSLDMDQVLGPIRHTQTLLIAIMLVAMAMAGIIAVINVRRLMKPLTALGAGAAEIADGDYGFSFRPSGFAEIDALAGQIASMSDAIKVREESIIANEERFRGLVNSIDGIVWEMNYPSFSFLFVSKQAESILGYPLQDWYDTLDFWALKTHPDDVLQAQSYCRLMAEKQEDHNFEFRMMTADDRIVWIRNLVTVVVENNRPVRLLGVMLDISSERELLDELSRSEQNYREIFNSTSDAIFIHDAETGKILDVNQAMLNIYKCTYEEAVTCGLEALCKGEPPYTVEDAATKIALAKEWGSCAFEWQARRPNGEVFWVDVSLRSATIGGEPRVIASVRDISSRKLSEDRLRELNERLQLLIDCMPVGCILWSPYFTVQLWNPFAESIFGFSQDEMIGKGPYGLILADEMKEEIDNVWNAIFQEDQTTGHVNENLTKERGSITCEWRNTPLKDLEGEIVGVISMVQDISERVAAEHELETYRSHLEKLVTERTQELRDAQQQLVQSERLAVLGQLTATVSHEIRNPLGTVANSLYLLRESFDFTDKPQLERPLKLAERNVERCDGIISDLLDFSRQRKIRKMPVDLNQWFRELLDEIKIPADVECQLDIALQKPVPVDGERLRRVIVNLLTNAMQALEECENQEKVIKITARDTDGMCEIVVEDNGPGMTDEVLAKIYEPMFSTKNFGVGLGVPIIRNIIEGHGGKVVYRSEPGKGTSVSMTLPMTA